MQCSHLADARTVRDTRPWRPVQITRTSGHGRDPVRSRPHRWTTWFPSPAHPSRFVGRPLMLKSLSTYLIVRGVLALIVGIVAVAWPGVTVYAFVVIFAVYAFLDAVVQAVRAFSGVPTRAANARILIALVDVAAGVVAISYPNITAVVLVVIVAIWAIAFGVLDLFAAF